tara:strand:- start:282 stop:725 length:444 start_codon:yes stop_codon:yes gene_type:complete
MAHVRQSIRNNVTTTVTGLATTGANVFQTRLFPLGSAKLPALCIYTKSEAIGINTITPPRQQSRMLEVIVEAYVKGTANVDSTLDTISVEIEEALATDITRGGFARDTKVTNFDVDYDGEGDQSIGVARFTIAVDYVTLENDVETAV